MSLLDQILNNKLNKPFCLPPSHAQQAATTTDVILPSLSKTQIVSKSLKVFIKFIQQ
jgi:hypothetical protein